MPVNEELKQIARQVNVLDFTGVCSMAAQISEAQYVQIELSELNQSWVNPHTSTVQDVSRFEVKIVSSSGAILGALRVFKNQPAPLTSEQNTILELLAKDVASQIDMANLNRRLLEAQELYQLVTETNVDLIFAKDEDFRIVFANKAFLSLYPEKNRDQIIGYTTLEAYDPREADEFLKYDKLAFAQGQSTTLEAIVFPNGEKRFLHTTKTRFEDQEGRAYILGVARDVTENETLIQKLKKSNDELDQFAYVASHDLKAPLTAIQRLAGWVVEDCAETLPDDSKEHLALLSNRVTRMSKLLDDLLEYSRVGRVQQHPETCSLLSIVDTIRDLADVPDSFTITVDDAQLYVPKLPFTRVLLNLITNAVKHHESDTGTVDIQCETLPNQYVLKVSDDGPGIPADMHHKVFAMFQTLKPRDEVEGSGMGLALVKKTTEHYAGNVKIMSNKKKGTTIQISWPIVQERGNDI